MVAKDRRGYMQSHRREATVASRGGVAASIYEDFMVPQKSIAICPFTAVVITDEMWGELKLIYSCPFLLRSLLIVI